MTIQIKSCKEGIQFAAAIQPRASQNKILGIHNHCLKIKLTSPPVDGAANQTCIRFLAKVFGIAPSRIAIVRGKISRNKTIQFQAMDEQTFLKKLASLISNTG